MTYTLRRLAAGNYDLLLDGAIIGSVIRNALPGGNNRGWRAELQDDSVVAQRPAPFTQAEHQFGSLEEVANWLGSLTVIKGKTGG